MKKVMEHTFIWMALGALIVHGWETVSTGTTASLNKVEFIGPDTGYVFGDSGVLLKSTNGGASWSSLPFPVKRNLRHSSFVTGRIGWVVAGDDSLYGTIDGGSTWNLHLSTPTPIGSVSFLDQNVGWVSYHMPSITAGGIPTGFAYLFTTSNGGSTWDTTWRGERGLGTLGEYISASKFSRSGQGMFAWGGTNVYGNGANGYTSGFWGRVLSTRDYATSADTLMYDMTVPIKDIQYTSDSTIWLLSSVTYHSYWNHWMLGIGSILEHRTKLFRSDDTGRTWTNRYPDSTTPQKLAAFSFLADSLYAVGDSGLLLTTTDGGLTWETAKLTDNDLKSIALVGDRKLFIAGSSGFLMRGDPATNVPVSMISRQPRQPAVRITGASIHYTTSVVTDVSIVVRDAMGRNVWSFRKVEKPGYHTLKLPGQHLPTGRYFVDFKAGLLRKAYSIHLP